MFNSPSDEGHGYSSPVALAEAATPIAEFFRRNGVPEEAVSFIESYALLLQ